MALDILHHFQRVQHLRHDLHVQNKRAEHSGAVLDVVRLCHIYHEGVVLVEVLAEQRYEQRVLGDARHKRLDDNTV